MKANILWIEGKKASNASLINALKKHGHHTEIVGSIRQAIKYAQLHRPDLTVAHLPSLRVMTYESLASIYAHLKGTPMIVLCPPEKKDDFSQNGLHVISVPTSVKKFTAAVHMLLPTQLEAGNLRLNLNKNVLICEGREINLTPRMTRLLSILMQHAGEVVDRKELFGMVWNTIYDGDTRSLDVHINWLRKAIEPDPKHPRYIITLRGLGYRLDT